MKAMQQKGPKVIIATLGKNGSIGYDGNSWYRFGIIECKLLIQWVQATVLLPDFYMGF